MARAVEDAKVGAPWADGFAVLVRHDSGELVEMGEIMSSPGGQKLGESDYSEGGVAAAEGQVWLAEIQGTQFAQVFRTQIRKFIQCLGQGLALALSTLCQAIEGWERQGLAGLQNDLRARHPVRAFAVNQVADDIEGCPCVFAFVAMRPRLGKITQQGIESGRGARK